MMKVMKDSYEEALAEREKINRRAAALPGVDAFLARCQEEMRVETELTTVADRLLPRDLAIQFAYELIHSGWTDPVALGRACMSLGLDHVPGYA